MSVMFLPQWPLLESARKTLVIFLQHYVYFDVTSCMLMSLAVCWCHTYIYNCYYPPLTARQSVRSRRLILQISWRQRILLARASKCLSWLCQVWTPSWSHTPLLQCLFCGDMTARAQLSPVIFFCPNWLSFWLASAASRLRNEETFISTHRMWNSLQIFSHLLATFTAPCVR